MCCTLKIMQYYNTHRSEQNKHTGIMLPAGLILFNGIVVPCMVTMFISPDCFYSVIVTPDAVQATYQYSTCDVLYTNDRSVCTSYTTVTSTTSYLPPFNYSYQCSSVLVSVIIFCCVHVIFVCCYE